MAFNGAGQFNRLYNWVQDRLNGIKISSSRMDAEMDGFATGLSNCITKDGQTTLTANIPFNNRRLTSLGDATADTDALNRQTADGRYVPREILTTSGTSTAYTATTGVGLTSFANARAISILVNVECGVSPTLNVNGLGAKKLRKFINGVEQDLASGDLVANGHYSLEYDAAANTGAGAWIVLNPALPKGSVLNSAYAEYTASVSLPTVIPHDDTIPQVTEGTQILSAAITPSSTANKVRVRVQISGASETNAAAITAAVFVNGGANAIGSDFVLQPTANLGTKVAFEFDHSPASTSEQTYTVRVGPSAGAGLRLNGHPSAGRRYGGTMRSTLVIEEIRG